MIAFIGKLFLIIEVYKLRFINKYKLSKLASHGVNCYIGLRVNV